MAQELSSSLPTLQNLPGASAYLLEQMAASTRADYILVDMNPSLSSLNQNLLMTSDAFLVPTSPDYFSVMAVDSLATVLPKWAAWARKAQELKVLSEATYAFPKTIPKFIGTIIQKFRPRSGAPSSGFQQWVDEIKLAVKQKLVPALRDAKMMHPASKYKKAKISDDYCLSVISDFNTLIAKAQSCRTPVFALTPEQIGQGGKVLAITLKARDAFRTLFEDLAKKVEILA
ncbi:MAG: AAA family ATPase [Planctomycetia bacterium]|nr:AAA family ATPase [Planctomycetia bacterium]